MSNSFKKYDNYDLRPTKKVLCDPACACEGYADIVRKIGAHVSSDSVKTIVVCDLYVGVRKSDVIEGLKNLRPVAIFDTDSCKLSDSDLVQKFDKSITDDRVFGVMSSADISDCFSQERLDLLHKLVDEITDGLVIIVGVGASILCKGDLLCYFDMPRWEIQLRYRDGTGNWLINNGDAAVLTKYKIGFFIEWRLADRHKHAIFGDIDYVIDTTTDTPKMVAGEVYRLALKQVSEQPFRLQPYFDPGVWGGQWMKSVFGLPPDKPNYAWSFDGVPEENSLNLQFGEILLETPAINLVLAHPQALLGERVYERFGAEFPIRFDLLDTMGGGNLSLQVHPLAEYIKQQFGMAYTQDESYYILDAKKGAFVYLGVKDGASKDEMESDLLLAQRESAVFCAEKYTNRIPVKPHDHISIPAGTVHCSGADTMVLEISATPYIFTFKLWDWGRVGQDGIARPIHIEHGMKNIKFERNLEWVERELVHVSQTPLKPGQCERTGLHSSEFIETMRITLSDEHWISMCGSVQVLNLVEGERAIIASKTGGFEPFEVHYAETFIIPASVEEYAIISPDNHTISVICAEVKATSRG